MSFYTEWEDTFPYSGDLETLSAEDCYTKDEVAEILKLAADSDLAVVPLVQTFGHMEFVLKLSQYKHLREVCNAHALHLNTSFWERCILPIILNQIKLPVEVCYGFTPIYHCRILSYHRL